jgi:hypothetical protein
MIAFTLLMPSAMPARSVASRTCGPLVNYAGNPGVIEAALMIATLTQTQWQGWSEFGHIYPFLEYIRSLETDGASIISTRKNARRTAHERTL